MRVAVAALMLALEAWPAVGIDNGLGLLPPMGWRSWNCFYTDIWQDKMQAVMDAMASKDFSLDGAPASLLDVGYTHVGVDDGWQACGTGYKGSFHDANGVPLVNTTKIPSMQNLVQYGKAKGLQVGWYGNNCMCAEHEFTNATYIASHMEQTVKAAVSYGFSAIKLDGCGQFRNLTWWAELLNSTGHAMLVENCHWGQTVPGQTTGDAPCAGTSTPSDCPYNFFRTSVDIYAGWDSIMHNLQTMVPYLGNPPLSRPGTWAYPDMLEVGNGPLTHAESRSHFGAWCITSSPLTLGYDVTNKNLTAQIWDIIANKEVIAVSQDWAGHPGTRTVGSDTGSPFQVWTKPLSGGDMAALVLSNSTSGTIEYTFTFSDFGFTGPVKVRDLYTHADLGTFTGSHASGPITSHDSKFFRFTPVA